MCGNSGRQGYSHLFGTESGKAEDQGRGEDLFGKTFHVFETGIEQNCIHSSFYTSKRRLKALTDE